MLAEMEKNKGAAAPLHDERSLPKLEELGISYIQSQRWQANLFTRVNKGMALAILPTFWRQKGDELKSTGWHQKAH